MALPKDGAQVRHESARDNRVAKKKQHERDVDIRKLRTTIEIGTAIERMLECAGWEYLQEWIVQVFSFRELLRIRKEDKEGLDDKMVKGAAFAEMQDWCQLKIHAAKQASKILDEVTTKK